MQLDPTKIEFASEAEIRAQADYRRTAEIIAWLTTLSAWWTLRQRSRAHVSTGFSGRLVSLSELVRNDREAAVHYSHDHPDADDNSGSDQYESRGEINPGQPRG